MVEVSPTGLLRKMQPLRASTHPKLRCGTLVWEVWGGLGGGSGRLGAVVLQRVERMLVVFSRAISGSAGDFVRRKLLNTYVKTIYIFWFAIHAYSYKDPFLCVGGCI